MKIKNRHWTEEKEGNTIKTEITRKGRITVKKAIVIYYSWSNGNTKRIAEQLAGEIGADLARIDTVKPYEGSYEEVVSQGQREVNEGYKPPIKPLDIDLSQYDVVAVGTPTWWYTMAPAVHTFLTQIDFTGKTVIPFMTNGGWPGHVIKDIKKECQGASFACEMEVKFDSTGGDYMETPEKKVSDWIQRVKKEVMEKE